ncbi:MAG: hypothetical protein LBD93_05990 [Treponema sp.]|jgi:hypothetical protein|nr:hypothetical protein [Treponema sp.]
MPGGGKSFAVVAEEIRKLAESSGEQSKTISGMLKKIKGSIDKITKSTEGVLLRYPGLRSHEPKGQPPFQAGPTGFS